MVKKSNPSNNNKRKSVSRLSIVLSKKTKDRLANVVEMMEAETTTEAVKDALRLLEYFLKVSSKGGKIFIQMPNEDIKQLELFGISTD